MQFVDPENGVAVWQFSLLQGVSHGISTRHGGVSPPPYDSLNLGLSTADARDHVLENRRRFGRAMSIDPARLVAGRLVHGNDVAVFSPGTPAEWPVDARPLDAGGRQEYQSFTADAIVSNVRGLHFLLTVADCVPILLLDRTRGVVGAAHAGWRGTARGIARRTIEAMTAAFGTEPADVVAGIGPSIGPCCYTVGEEVVTAFRTNGFEPVLRRTKDTRLDMWASNERQLSDSGLRAECIETHGVCTACNSRTFYSHRGEGGLTGRMGFTIGLV